MGQKDLTEKSLEQYPDVFADVVNALMHRGRQVLEEKYLQSAPTETLYPGTEGRLRNQFHDVSMYEMARLPAEVRARFQSDMRLVVDFLAEGKNYVPTGQKIVHVEALFRMYFYREYNEERANPCGLAL